MSSKWIRTDKRLAIMLRGNLTCTYCGATVEDGASLTLDHVIPRNLGGSNHESNLVCSCMDCNGSKSDTPLTEWLGDRENASGIAFWVQRQAETALAPYREAAKEILESRRVVEFTGNQRYAQFGRLNGNGN